MDGFLLFDGRPDRMISGKGWPFAMKAVILAGGAGTRLQPLTTELPKPMVSLLGRPVLEHILLLLRRHQVTEAAVTLHYHPEAITGYFGDGSAWGMRLHYFYEDTPLGTAGGVKACKDFLGQEDFLVISGDCVSDFDLTDCYRLHRQRQAEATLLLHRVAEPLEYGLVRTDQEGQVLAFVEKPGWGQVFTDQVNTGIYLLSPSVLDLVPEGEPFDFSKNLFPELLRQKRALYGQVPVGYWRDMGECGSYLQTVEDALEGRVKLDMTLPQQSTGVWSAEPIPDSVEVLAPCWIGSNVTLGPWSNIGPHTVLESGSTVGRGCRLRRTVVMGAAVGAESQVEGAILCPHAKIGEGCFLYPGSVVGADAWLGDHATLRPQVRVWPGLHIQPGSRVTSTQVHGPGPGSLRFDAYGVIRGVIGGDMDTEQVIDLGSALAGMGQVALGHCGGAGAEALALAAAAGVTAAGGWVIRHDGTTPAAANWLCEYYGLSGGLFLEQQGERLNLYPVAAGGQPLEREAQRKMENDLLRRNFRRPPAAEMGGETKLASIMESYLAAAVQSAGGAGSYPCTLAVEPGQPLLNQGLRWLGCQVVERDVVGVPAMALASGGRELLVWTEDGERHSREEVLLLTCAALLDSGQHNLYLPPEAPAAIERLARDRGGTVERMESGVPGGCQRSLRDGLFAACQIARYVQRTGETVSQLFQRLPGCQTQRRVVPLRTNRSAVMGAISRQYPDAQRMKQGMRLNVKDGSVWIAPANDREALRVITEGARAEIAQELCDFITNEAGKWDAL